MSDALLVYLGGVVSLSPHTSCYLTRMLQADVFYPVPRFFNNWGNFHVKICGFSLALENNRKNLAVPEPAQPGWNEKQLPIWMADVSWFVSLRCAVPNSDCFGRWPQPDASINTLTVACEPLYKLPHIFQHSPDGQTCE